MIQYAKEIRTSSFFSIIQEATSFGISQILPIKVLPLITIMEMTSIKEYKNLSNIPKDNIYGFIVFVHNNHYRIYLTLDSSKLEKLKAIKAKEGLIFNNVEEVLCFILYHELIHIRQDQEGKFRYVDYTMSAAEHNKLPIEIEANEVAYELVIKSRI